MSNTVNAILEYKVKQNLLFPQQRKAIIDIEKYLSAYNEEENLNGLVAMPTGSGKTGIMAILSRCRRLDENVLIVSPRKAITDQIYDEISEDFFKTIDMVPKTIPKKVYRYKKKMRIEDLKKPCVIITTIQKVDYIKKGEDREEKDNIREYKDLLKHINLIIFDEGHYEPAKSWSKTIREFKCRRILFTATPFRSDLRGYKIDWDNYHYTRHEELVSLKYLKKVKFIDVPKMDSSVSQVIPIIMKKRAELLSESDKIIIACNQSESIRAICIQLSQLEESFIGIHENFPRKKHKNEVNDYELNLVKDVPKNIKETYCVHQYKLMEGIDDKRFRLLAIFEPLRNTRALIQQIGRIIRNPNPKIQQQAYVLNFTGIPYKEYWNRFLKTDISKVEAFEVYMDIDEMLPADLYWEKRFFNKYEYKKSLSTSNIMKNKLRLQLRANLYKTPNNFSMKDFENVLEKHLESSNCIYEIIPYDNKVLVCYYINFSNSEYLVEDFFPEINHNVIVCKLYGSILSFYNTNKWIPKRFLKKDITDSKTDQNSIELQDYFYPINADDLKKLIPSEKESLSKLTQVSLKNANIGITDIRGHAYNAKSIEEATPFLNDHSHFVSTAFGVYTGEDFIKEKIKKLDNEEETNGKNNDEKKVKPYNDGKKRTRRYKTYLGFIKGRIAQGTTEYNLKDYFNWLDLTVKKIKEGSGSLDVFNRYAEQIKQIKKPTPLNILIDYFDLQEVYSESNSEINKNSLEKLYQPVTDKCFDIKYDNEKKKYIFKIPDSDNDKETGHIVEVDFDVEKNRFEFTSSSLENATTISVTNNEKNKTTNLIKEMNRRQCVRILNKDKSLYAFRNFYKPRLKYGEKYKNEILLIEHFIYSIEELGTAKSEKGKKIPKGEILWEKDSIFGMIARNNKSLASYFGDVRLMICDDMGTEIADFIVLSNNKLIFIHAKGVKGEKDNPKKYGASGLSIVCSQAIKNIHYISMFDESKPELNKWGEPWRWKNKNLKIDMTVDNRIVINKTNIKNEPDELWEEICKYKTNPNKEKEVWIVLSKTLSKNTLIEQLKSKNPKPEAIQSYLIIQNTIASVSSLGAKLKIFCH